MSGHPQGHVGRWQKKPVTVDALEFEVGWTDENEVQQFCEGHHPNCYVLTGVGPGGLVASLRIQTLEGEMKVNDGDFVIKGVQGELYPCKPDIFLTTYRPVV